MTMKQLVLEAAARGYCHPKNSGKEVDVDLLDAICEEIMNALAPTEEETCPQDDLPTAADVRGILNQ